MDEVRPRIAVVGATRPNFVKIAPLLRTLEPRALVDFAHTGQHYDWKMSGSFFEDLEIRSPDINLEVGSGTHAEQTAGVLVAFERHLVETQPDAVVVVGDVNSTLASALAAATLGVRVAHVEAGLRSRDWAMPEEINRILTDRLSTWLFTPSQGANANLEAEGISQENVFLVGNIMIDSLLQVLPAARGRFEEMRRRLELPEHYGVITLHRPSNVDGDRLEPVMKCLNEIGREMPLVFPVHPRTAQRLRDLGLSFEQSVLAIEPLGYRDFLGLLDASTVAFTDSGGVQEETSVLGVPCLTLRDSTERPITTELGTNRVVGRDRDAILAGFSRALEQGRSEAAIPLWDGQTAPRIADTLIEALTHSGTE